MLLNSTSHISSPLKSSNAVKIRQASYISIWDWPSFHDWSLPTTTATKISNKMSMMFVAVSIYCRHCWWCVATWWTSRNVLTLPLTTYLGTTHCAARSKWWVYCQLTSSSYEVCKCALVYALQHSPAGPLLNCSTLFQLLRLLSLKKNLSMFFPQLLKETLTK